MLERFMFGLYIVGVDFVCEGVGEYGEFVGMVILYVDDCVVVFGFMWV